MENGKKNPVVESVISNVAIEPATHQRDRSTRSELDAYRYPLWNSVSARRAYGAYLDSIRAR